MSNVRLTDWAINRSYVEDEIVYVQGQGNQFEDRIYRCLENHVSVSFATEFGTNKWEEIIVRGAVGSIGATGVPGPKGDTGEKGDPGANGSAGANGVFSEIASQGEAQTGTDNAKGMTPLRVAEAISSQVPSLTAITDLVAKDTAQDVVISGLNSRLNILEGVSNLIRARGRQRVNNNQTDELYLLGADSTGQQGVGNIFEVDRDSAESAVINLEIRRKTDSEFRVSNVQLRMQFIDTQWYIARDTTAVLAGGQPDGVVFGVDTITGDVGRVWYTSSNMSGTYDNDESYMVWLIEKIKKNF
jgi:hypothetical protein